MKIRERNPVVASRKKQEKIGKQRYTANDED